MDTAANTTPPAESEGDLSLRVEIPPITFSLTDAAIEELRAEFAGLSAETPEGYEEVRKAIGTLRGLRGKVEARRKELKAPALEYGRKLDAEAKRITAAIVEIEKPLKAEKKAIDDEKERERRAEEEAERARVEAELEAQRQERLREEREAREAEEARLAAEREELERHAEAQRAEQERLAAERRALAEERARIDARDREAREAEERKAAEARREQEAAEARARAEAERPDVEKLDAWVEQLVAVPVPDLESPRLRVIASEFLHAVADHASRMLEKAREV